MATINHARTDAVTIHFFLTLYNADVAVVLERADYVFVLNSAKPNGLQVCCKAVKNEVNSFAWKCIGNFLRIRLY